MSSNFTTRDRYGRRLICNCYYADSGNNNNNNNSDNYNMRRIAQFIHRKHITVARRYYSNIRVVNRDGVNLVVTQDYNRRRVNVGTRNGYIVRIYGFY